MLFSSPNGTKTSNHFHHSWSLPRLMFMHTWLKPTIADLEIAEYEHQ